MDHHARVEALVRAHLEQPDLARAALLGRGADEDKPTRHIVLLHPSPHPQKRSDSGDGDQVVLGQRSERRWLISKRGAVESGSMYIPRRHDRPLQI